MDELLDWEEPDLKKAERLLKVEAGQSEVRWVMFSPDPDQSGCEELCSWALTPDRGLNTCKIEESLHWESYSSINGSPWICHWPGSPWDDRSCDKPFPHGSDCRKHKSVECRTWWLNCRTDNCCVGISLFFNYYSGQLFGATDFKLIHNHGASALNIDMNILSNFHKLYSSESVNQSLKNIRFENCL